MLRSVMADEPESVDRELGRVQVKMLMRSTANATMTAAIPKKRTYRTLCPVTPCRSGMLATTAGGLPGAVSRWSPDFESSNCMHRSSADDAPKHVNQHCSEMVPVDLPPCRRNFRPSALALVSLMRPRRSERQNLGARAEGRAMNPDSRL